MKSKPMVQADLHCHTTASDGLLTPKELVERAASRGLKAIGITDHDTIGGWEEAQRAAESLPIQVIKGIEINTDWQKREIHILGYLLDQTLAFCSQLTELQEKRIHRIIEIIRKLEIINLDIKFEEVRHYAQGDSMGRPHVAQALVNKGYAQDVREAFDRYLRVGRPAYVPRYKLTPVEAIKIIRDAKGVAVLAHPGSQHIEKEIEQLVEAGLQGIEVYHPDHSVEDSTRYGILAQKLGIIATGGSDFHGIRIKAGIDVGDWGVDFKVVDEIERLKQQ